jgi:hypothetical protein
MRINLITDTKGREEILDVGDIIWARNLGADQPSWLLLALVLQRRSD